MKLNKPMEVSKDRLEYLLMYSNQILLIDSILAMLIIKYEKKEIPIYKFLSKEIKKYEEKYFISHIDFFGWSPTRRSWWNAIKIDSLEFLIHFEKFEKYYTNFLNVRDAILSLNPNLEIKFIEDSIHKMNEDMKNVQSNKTKL